MTPIDWRRGTPADAPAFSLLGAATFLESFAHDHPGAALIAHARNAHGEAYYESVLADPENIAIIGETPLGAPVAYALLMPADVPVPPEPDDFELKRFYLLGPWQGNGNGDAMMDIALAAAHQRGTKRLLLAVYPQNDRARRFYGHHGFEQIGQMTFMVGDTPFDDLIYARRL
jgi:GNAT superfamily N-acetyltransferase